MQIFFRSLFQFYDSPIKSHINIHITVFASFMFQFYDSPIKSALLVYADMENKRVSIL